MGLGGMKYAWQRQTKDFGHTKGDQYSSLVTDNRGIGDSDKPTSRYSTSAMAQDIVEVLDHVGWTGNRELHVIGISMGGMIAQEIVSPFISSSSSAQSTGGVIVFGPDAIPSVFEHKFSQVLSTRASNISHTQHHPVISTVD
jgi:pimeloyl-ACP methyl ester carboxylesterase